jgi:N-acyl-L-homoserine lactone synthetase
MQSLKVGGDGSIPDALFREMYRERKRVFVDLLGWNIPVLDDEFEFDQFDGPTTQYLMMASPDGEHRGSLRMLSTDGPTLLGDIFPFLCDGPPPASPDCWEISRFCLSRRLRAADRRSVRNQLVTAAANFALDNGISAYVCIADMGWLTQIVSFGWRCHPLGLPQQLDCGLIGAMRIEITPETPALMHAAGTWQPIYTVPTDSCAA